MVCCCVISTASGVSCCDPTEIVQVQASCGSSSCQAEKPMDSDEQPCGDTGCSCCLKAPSTTPDWSPPVDTIGTSLPPFALAEPLESAAGWQAPGVSGKTDPPPEPRDPDQLRGHVILQV